MPTLLPTTSPTPFKYLHKALKDNHKTKESINADTQSKLVNLMGDESVALLKSPTLLASKDNPGDPPNV